MKGLKNLLRAVIMIDDVTLIASTPAELARLKGGFCLWAKINELKIGLSKCGAIGFSGSNDILEAQNMLREKKNAKSLCTGLDE